MGSGRVISKLRIPGGYRFETTAGRFEAVREGSRWILSFGGTSVQGRFSDVPAFDVPCATLGDAVIRMHKIVEATT